MALIAVMHQQILDYIFGDDFERIQEELLIQMNDHTNVKKKESALKFFLEICALLKSIQLTNRFVQTCNNAFTKLMTVLAQTFNIMIPDKETLLAEIICDREKLVKIYRDRDEANIAEAEKQQRENLQLLDDSQDDEKPKVERPLNLEINPQEETIRQYL